VFSTNFTKISDVSWHEEMLVQFIYDLHMIFLKTYWLISYIVTGTNFNTIYM